MNTPEIIDEDETLSNADTEIYYNELEQIHMEALQDLEFEFESESESESESE